MRSASLSTPDVARVLANAVFKVEFKALSMLREVAKKRSKFPAHA